MLELQSMIFWVTSCRLADSYQHFGETSFLHDFKLSPCSECCILSSG